ncbi:cellulose synthase family protein [Marinigracilibium pacificum]|uniref:Glycosyltransferase n=1 Tax=Marinigracilibium pacificum TaxID=2729599 RepID=A0A848J4S3_9BACT|nr:cellulose synthase family protein [Marinigracilibium pacificum]NMM49510.1 glycosyltransferase [Marinigracilibium pacificum]
MQFSVWELVLMIIYVGALFFIFAFSLTQLHLTSVYKNFKKKKKLSSPKVENWPIVTVQLPVYNELYVIERLIESVGKLDYPEGKLEIQVLDDSTDESVEIAAAKIKELQEKGVDIKHIRRPERTGFKAGALDYGLQICRGEFIAIFDADFTPDTLFLKKTVPYFNYPEIGVVQSRWGHLNKNYSLLTRLQAFGLDAHFYIEQVGRMASGSFINFNGTGGIWRKQCIVDAGGWNDDTLTEDLDLSYRAQLKGWKFHYLENLVSPAELPIIMPAVKSQQFRWNKGAAETAKKNLGKLWTANIPLKNKIHGTFHLLNSSVFIFLLVASLVSVPLLRIKNSTPEFNWLFDLGSIFLIGFIGLSYYFWVANKQSDDQKDSSFWSFLKTYFLFLTMSMGLSLHNAIAVFEGWIGKKSPFIRTPKFNVSDKNSWRKNRYLNLTFSPLSMLEGLLAIYFLFGIFYGVKIGDYGMILFHVMLASGFSMVFYYSAKAT